MASHFPVLARLMSSNAQWASDVEKAEPGFFAKGAQGQSPKVLWIGCADSRVPESVVLACRPGEVFVHRNIANQYHPSDDSALSVATYAIHQLGVEHVVVVGHTGCGGAAACSAAAQNRALPVPPAGPDAPINRWLGPLVQISADVLKAGAKDPLGTIVEENVRAQVANVASSDPVTSAWAAGKSLHIHGWVYELETGKIKDLGVSMGQ